MLFKKYILFVLLVPMFSFGQIRISENIQESKIVKDTGIKLLFLDFWATWCGPCVTVSKYLGTLQAKYPNDFYILALSQENAEIVKGYMKKRPSSLAVAIDYEGETFTKYGVASLPYGVLINANGDKIWEGHPAELKDHHIKSFLRKNNEEVALKDMLTHQAYKKISNTSSSEKIPEKNFQYTKLLNSFIDELQIEKRQDYLELNGTLKQILAYVNLVSASQIELASESNEVYKITFKYASYSHDKMKRVIYKALKIKESRNIMEGEVITFDIKNAKLWDNKQIDWGNDTPNFLIGDSDIKADNVSLNDITYKLSSLLKIPIIVQNNMSYLDENLSSDWDVHYKYFDLMVANLLDNYGIVVKKRPMTYETLFITKKTP